MEVYVGRYRANFRSESGNLICKHAWSGSLDCIVPVVVVIAQSVGEIQDCHLADVRRVFGDVEVCRLHTALSHRMGNQEEVKLTIDNFRLLDEALIDVGTLGWVVDELLTVIHSLLEESLANSFVHNNESNLGRGIL